MKIQYISDLHLEIEENRRFFEKNPIQANADYLFLAGDIIPIKYIEEIEPFLESLSQTFKSVFWIPGNHEFYDLDYFEYQQCHIELKDNVHLVNNTSMTIKGKEFVFSTLWSEINEDNRWEIQSKINDFKYIRYKEDFIDIYDLNSMHYHSLSFIKERMNDSTIKDKIIVTHHCPVLLDSYKESVFQSVYCTNLIDLIKKHSPRLWIYGHTHSQHDTIKVDSTKIVTNQFNLERGNLNLNQLVIEI